MHRRQPPDPPVFGSPFYKFRKSTRRVRRKTGTATNSRLWNWLAVPGLPRGTRPRPQPFPSVTSEIIQSKIMDIASTTTAPRAPGSGSALAGFLVSGFLLALLGAILPAWGYHRDPPDFIAVGNYFL